MIIILIAINDENFIVYFKRHKERRKALNNVVLIGEVSKMPTNYDAEMILKVARPTIEDENHVDLIPIKLKGNLLEVVLEHCKIGSVLGVKAYVETERKINFKDKEKFFLLYFAERITFLNINKERKDTN